MFSAAHKWAQEFLRASLSIHISCLRHSYWVGWRELNSSSPRSPRGALPLSYSQQKTWQGVWDSNPRIS